MQGRICPYDQFQWSKNIANNLGRRIRLVTESPSGKLEIASSANCKAVRKPKGGRPTIKQIEMPCWIHSEHANFRQEDRPKPKS